MNVLSEEKLMYAVIKAIYDSGIPMSFKGAINARRRSMILRYHKVRH